MNSPLHVLFARELPRGWAIATVDAIKASEKNTCVAGPFGSDISSKYFATEGVPVIRGGNLSDDLTRFVPKNFVFVSPERAASYRAQHVRAGDLVFTCWGTIGQVGLIPENGPFLEYIISNKQLKLRPNTTLTDPVYLFYYFASPQMVAHVRNRAIGAAVPGINLGILKTLEVVVPPLAEQRRIASILSAYDDLIENNTRRIAILEEMARRIYEEWFVRFRFPGHEGVRMVESELGLVPEGWKVACLEDVCLGEDGIQTGPFGSQLHKSDYSEVGVPVLMPKDLIGFRINTESITRIPMPTAARIGRHRMQPGDIVYGRRGDIGRRAYIMAHQSGWICGTGCLRIRPDPAAIGGWYLFNFIGQDSVVGLIAGRAHGVTMPNLNTRLLESVPVVLPPRTLQDRFESMTFPLAMLRETLTAKNANLRTTRDLLLPKLISGELDVSDLPEPQAAAA